MAEKTSDRATSQALGWLTQAVESYGMLMRMDRTEHAIESLAMLLRDHYQGGKRSPFGERERLRKVEAAADDLAKAARDAIDNVRTPTESESLAMTELESALQGYNECEAKPE